MNIRPSLSSFVIASAMSVGLLGFAVPALSAPQAQRAETCTNARVCTYAGGQNHDGGSYNTLLTVRSAGTTRTDLDVGLQNRLSSWINRTTTNARFFYDTGGNGHCVTMNATDMKSAIASNPDDNEAESHGYNGRCP